MKSENRRWKRDLSMEERWREKRSVRIREKREKREKEKKISTIHLIVSYGAEGYLRDDS